MNFDDVDMVEMVKDEFYEFKECLFEFEYEMNFLFLFKDKDDSVNVLVEICVGIGGDEVVLFVGDFYCMYE